MLYISTDLSAIGDLAPGGLGRTGQERKKTYDPTWDWLPNREAERSRGWSEDQAHGKGHG